MMEEQILRIEDECKYFGRTKANNHISLSISRGSIHGLAGENGSGKSTLASVICGIYHRDSGEIYKDGEPYDAKTPQDAYHHRIAMVVQELGVISDLSGVVNMYLGRMEPYTVGGMINFRKMEADANEVFDKWHLTRVPLKCPAAELSIEQRKILELARALVVDPDLLILDEMSQALSKDSRDTLYDFMKYFVQQGRSILMITHDLEEMLEQCDTVSVLRDGEMVCTKAVSEVNLEELKRLMIGRQVSGDYYRNDSDEDYMDEVVLDVQHLTTNDGMVQDVTFQLHRGEILAVCGLSDAGIHDLGKALFGLGGQHTGEITAVAANMKIRNSGDMIKAGGAYLSKDRDADGLMLDTSIRDNLAVPSAGLLAKGPFFLNPAAVSRFADRISDRFEIKARSTRQAVRRLSGGNKQKVNLGRWLAKDLDFIILDCPTRGVDIGVKAYIYEILKESKKKGLAVLMICDELTEATGMADRMIVMREHAMSGILSRATDFNDEKIAEVML
ncbi:MAG: sugar ABC transporter ATP-binding protein [Lachnospiraceae bacterium]|nr:sugar ABC transporter ATP-binding protein [Lachnospiraceae bacterium]